MHRKPVCSACGLDFKISKIGVLVGEHRKEAQEPFRVMYGDETICPGCGCRIVSNFAKSYTHSPDPMLELMVSQARSLNEYISVS